jgi:hypothetical protein
MKYRDLSPYEPIVLECVCKSTYVGQKRDAHEWIKNHGTCRTTDVKPIRVVSTGARAIRAYGRDDDNRVSRNVLERADARITQEQNC